MTSAEHIFIFSICIILCSVVMSPLYDPASTFHIVSGERTSVTAGRLEVFIEVFFLLISTNQVSCFSLFGVLGRRPLKWDCNFILVLWDFISVTSVQTSELLDFN